MKELFKYMLSAIIVLWFFISFALVKDSDRYSTDWWIGAPFLFIILIGCLVILIIVVKKLISGEYNK